MPIPGSSVFRQLQAAVDDVRGRLDTARREADVAARAVQSLAGERAAACLDLARHYLPDVRRETIQGAFAGIRGELESILARKERSERETSQRLAKLAEERASVDEELSATTVRLNQLVEERGRLQKVVADRLAQDADFQRRSQAALEAEAILKQNEERADEIRREAEAKRPAFEKSRLFQYLHRRRFGLAEYRREGLTRRLDRWVANLIGYERARRSYDFLQTTPKLVAAEIERRRADFDARMEEIEAIEKAAAEEAGLTDVLARGRTEGEARDRLVRRVGEIETELKRDRATLEGLQHEQGAHYQEALAKMRTFLSATEGPMLAGRARETRDPRDDEIVSRILSVDARIAQSKTAAADVERKQQALRRSLDGVELLTRRFRQAEFDSERSSFEAGFDADEAIRSVVEGATEPETVWARMRRAQQFSPAWGTQVGAGVGEVLSSPATAAILQAMVQVAGTVLESSAQRSVARRRGRSWHWDTGGGDVGGSEPSPSWSAPSAPSAPVHFPSAPSVPPPMPIPSAPPPPAPMPSSGGFTSGEGF